MIGDPTAQLAKDLDVYIEADGMTERALSLSILTEKLFFMK